MLGRTTAHNSAASVTRRGLASVASRVGCRGVAKAVAGAAMRPRLPLTQVIEVGRRPTIGISLIPSAAPILWRGAWAPPFQPAPPPILCVGVRKIFVPGSAPRRAAKRPLGPKGALPGCPNVGVRRLHPRPLSGEAGHSASVYGAKPLMMGPRSYITEHVTKATGPVPIGRFRRSRLPNC